MESIQEQLNLLVEKAFVLAAFQGRVDPNGSSFDDMLRSLQDRLRVGLAHERHLGRNN